KRQQRLVGTMLAGGVLAIGGVAREVLKLRAGDGFEWFAAGMVAVGLVTIVISTLVRRFLRRARSRRVVPISRAISATTPTSRFAVYVDAECAICGDAIALREKGGRVYPSVGSTDT